ncbi:MAG: hypothetical protein NTW87_11640 [Planctomycetota bacterium]|nr:hypothetical protein [Planctomycetota bacterium]
MASAKKRRSPPRLHVSTAVVLMFVAGVLLWANVHTYESGLPPGVLVDPAEGTTFSGPLMCSANGWPLRCYWPAFEHWELGNLSLDVIIAVAAMVVAAVISERCESARRGLVAEETVGQKDER